MMLFIIYSLNVILFMNVVVNITFVQLYIISILIILICMYEC